MVRLFAVLFASLPLCYLYIAYRPSTTLLVIFSIVNILTFILYWFDKRAAYNNHWRIRESKLHYLALVGGWFGALVAQGVVRHKIRKNSFMRVFYLTVILNMFFLFCYFNRDFIVYKVVELLS